MKNYLTMGIFAHANAGKTTLTENLLYLNNQIKEIGRVDSGNTVTDDLNVERNRGITVRSSLVSIERGDNIIQIIDTPGHVDFSSEVERAINVLDFAILVMSAVEGVESQTYAIWKELRKNKIPTIIFVNKIDRKNASFERTLQDIKEKLSESVYPYVDENGSSKLPKKAIIENFATIDENAFNTYIQKGDIEEETLNELIMKSFNASESFPVFCGSALKSQGVELIYDFLGNKIRNHNIESQELKAYVYMIRINDGQRNSYIKLLSGNINNFADIIVNGEKYKIINMRTAHGAEMTPINQACPGQIVVVNGLECPCGTKIGDFQIAQSSFAQPLVKMQIVPQNSADMPKLIDVMKILNAEDPHYNARYDEYTKEVKIDLMGEVQGQIVKEIIRDRFKLDVDIINPRVIYKETPTSYSKGKSSYTSVSAIELEINPLPRGSGLVIDSKFSTDFLHIKYQNQAKRLIEMYCKQGLYGWEVTDAEISITGGKFDSMGSDPQHFNICVPLALFRALKLANEKTLEPMIEFIVTTPSNTSNAVINHLYSKKAKINEFKDLWDFAQIVGIVPFAEMTTFPIVLNKLSSGLGTYSYEFSQYKFSDKIENFDKRYGPDPSNETKFVIGDMKASLASLDNEGTGKKPRRSKFAREQLEREIAEEKKRAMKRTKTDEDFFDKGM